MQLTPGKKTILERRGCLRRYGDRREPQVHLVCFPWCGAGASVYRQLASSLPAHIDLFAVQLPGREDRFSEGRIVSMEQMVEHVMDDIVSIFDRPLVLFGHSMGAYLAYEVALALRARVGREASLLIVSGNGSPDSVLSDNRNWHTANEEAFIANLRDIGGTPREIFDDREMMQVLLPLLRADYQALETYPYRPQTPLSSPLIACAGDEDNEVTRDEMYAWQRYTTGPSQVHWFSGDHFYLSSQPHLLAQRLQEWIAASEE